MKLINVGLLLLVFTIGLTFPQRATAQVVLKSSVLGNGGDVTEGGEFQINGTAGQPAIGVSSNLSNIAFSGFWYIVAQERLPRIGVNPTSLTFNAVPGGSNPPPKKLSITNLGGDTLFWNVSKTAGWISSLSPSSGECTVETDEVTVSVDISGLVEGKYNDTITIAATGASNTPQIVPVTLNLFSYRYEMDPGWHLMSFSVNNCFYEGTPPDQPDCVNLVNISGSGFSHLADWFTSALTPNNPVYPAWQTVLGATESMDSSGLYALHSLKSMSPIYGYWVRISDGTGGAALILEGAPFNVNCSISLQQGWNLVGFPSTIGFYDEPPPAEEKVPDGTTWVQVEKPVAAYVFQSIINKCSMILSDYGAHDPKASIILSSLHYIAPGHAYWIRMDEPGELVYPSE